LGERLLCKQEVIGSIPFTSTSIAATSIAGIGTAGIGIAGTGIGIAGTGIGNGRRRRLAPAGLRRPGCADVRGPVWPVAAGPRRPGVVWSVKRECE
jgi:hypothetical protein